MFEVFDLESVLRDSLIETKLFASYNCKFGAAYSGSSRHSLLESEFKLT